MPALLNFATALISVLIAFGVVTIFPESVSKIKKMTGFGDATTIALMWAVLAFAAFAAKDIIEGGVFTQSVGAFFTGIISALTTPQ